MKEPISATFAEGRLLVVLLGEVDHHSARPLREQIDRLLYLNRPEEFVISLEKVSFMDSSGLGLILGRLAVCQHFSCPMRLEKCSEQTLRIFELAGLGRVPGLEIEGLAKKEKVKR